MGFVSGKKKVVQALTEEQVAIIFKGMKEDYPLEESIQDIDLIADLTALKLKIRRDGI